MSTAVALGAHEALAAALEPGQDIVIGQGAGTPRTLIRALAEHRERLAGSRILVGLLLDDDFPDLPEAEIRTFFPSGPFSGAAYERKTLYELAVGLRSRAIPVDVALVQGTPARGGRHSLGATVDYAHAAVERAGVAVLETGDAVPWAGVRSTIAAGDNVLAVACEAAPREIAGGGEDRGREAALGRELARWVPDGVTVELGMGGWVPALVACLRERRGLKLHTGLVGDWVFALDLDAPPVATAAMGSPALYDRLPALAPADETHAPETLARLDCFRTINAVLGVDLQGRATSEVAGARRGGIGGLPDFARAAHRNADGLSIIAVRADRIVARVERVSLDAIDVVVTEYGSADLRGRDPAERARALIAIAARERRPALERSFE